VGAGARRDSPRRFVAAPARIDRRAVHTPVAVVVEPVADLGGIGGRRARILAAVELHSVVVAEAGRAVGRRIEAAGAGGAAGRRVRERADATAAAAVGRIAVEREALVGDSVAIVVEAVALFDA